MSTPGQQPLGLEEPSQPLRLEESSRPDHIGKVKLEYRPARDILTRATGFMDAYDFTLNPYAGCSFGCTYCYAAFFSRSTEKRESWGQWIDVKENAVDLLLKQRHRLDDKLIYMSSVTDPYQPIERKLKLTRQLLEIMAEHHRPRLVVQTRSPDVVRDSGLFARITANGGRVRVNITVTTDDEDIRRVFEPNCPGNRVRLRAAHDLRAEGVDTCITMTPLLLVRNSETFAEGLLDTGVENFIVQPFHFQRGKFLAGTRDEALRLMKEKLKIDAKESLHDAYMTHYQDAASVLFKRLPQLGEGKDGFKPPF